MRYRHVCGHHSMDSYLGLSYAKANDYQHTQIFD
jgi:hypothetical protein